MVSQNVLYVAESPSDIPHNITDDSFVIESELGDICEDEYRRLDAKLYDLGVSTDSLPIFNICRFWIYSGHYSTERESMSNYIFIIDRLQNEISEKRINKIKSYNIGASLEPALHDAGRPYDVEVELYQEPSNRKNRIIPKLITLFWAFLLIADQLIGSLLGDSHQNNSTTDTVFVPSQTRFRSIEPVLKNMNTGFSIILKRSCIMRVFKGRVNPELKKYDTSLAHTHVSLSNISSQIRYLLLEFIPHELIRNTTEKKLIASVKEEFGLNLEDTIPYIFDTIYQSRIANQILKYYIYRGVLQSTNPERIVSGIGYSPSAEAIWLAAQDLDAEALDLPHTITLNPPQTGEFTDAAFLSGEFAEEYISTNYPKRAEGTKLKPNGRPYIELLIEEVSGETQRTGDQVKVLIATQPFDEDTREMFLQGAFQGLEQVQIPTETIIKTHPSESKELYTSFKKSSNHDFDIVEEDLWPELKKSDIVITLNSNVGLEAILADCLSVTINLRRFYNHKPLPFALASPVPVLKSGAEIDEFFKSLSADKIESLKISQKKFVEDGYELSGVARSVASDLGSV
jgi:hypothetical protein